jgi:hypothetical protein
MAHFLIERSVTTQNLLAPCTHITMETRTRSSNSFSQSLSNELAMSQAYSTHKQLSALHNRLRTVTCQKIPVSVEVAS